MPNINITGNWKKLSETSCSSKYPDSIEFYSNGIYKAKSYFSKLHPLWDAGSFLVKDQTISISTSNDAVIAYHVVQKDNYLVFKDPEGCEIRYERA